ncbi:MAG: hypothetical protein J5883_08100 [Clostridiales bacterium]|nr:hypothetical protein [Clostridiales bacterium]
MKKTTKTVISSVLALSVMAGATGCSLFDKAASECQEVGDEFIQAALEREISDMIDLCEDEDDATAALSAYEAEDEAIDLILEKAEFEAGKAECKTKDGKGKIEYTITLPDYEAALDEEPEDEDEFGDLLADVEETVEINVTLEFKLNKKDKWQISNPDDFAEDFFGELDEIDFPFGSDYEDWVDYLDWWGDNGSGVYSDAYYIELDIIPTSDHQDYDNDIWEFYYEVYNEGGTNLIYTSPDKTDAGWYIEAYFYADYVWDQYELPSDTYRIVFYDLDGHEIAEDSCTVN